MVSKRAILLLLCLLIPAALWAGPTGFKCRPHAGKVRIAISMAQVIREGLAQGFERDGKWYTVQYSGGIDMRRGGTNQTIGASDGIRDMVLDLFPDGASLTGGRVTVDGASTLQYMMRVDVTGDSLVLWQGVSSAKGVRSSDIQGPLSSVAKAGVTDEATYIQLACSNNDRIAPEGRPTHYGFCTHAALAGCAGWLIDSSSVWTADSIIFYDHWFWDSAIGAGDTLKTEIWRRMACYKSRPYFLVRYRFRKHAASDRDSIRYAWLDVPSLGLYLAGGTAPFNTNASIQDVGYMLNYGRVEYEHLFTNPDPPIFMMLNIGSRHDSLVITPVAGRTCRDTLLSSGPAHASPESLALDFGSGTASIAAFFVAFNPTETVPTEVMFKDTAESWADCDFEGDFADYDTTHGYGWPDDQCQLRSIFARTDKVELSASADMVVEYAIGRPYFPEVARPWWPMIPWIRFTDGAVLAPSYYRTR